MLKEVIKLVKLDITTFIASVAPILSLYILGGFINREIIGVFGLTYMFQYMYSMFSGGLNYPIFIYAFKDIKNDKDKSMSILFSGLTVFILIELVFYISFMIFSKQFLYLLKVPNELIEICYVYVVYAIAAIGLQLIDFIVYDYYNYTARLKLNNKLSFIYASVRIGGALVYVFFSNILVLNNIEKIFLLVLPLVVFTAGISLTVVCELRRYKIKFTWDFLKAIKYGVRDIVRCSSSAIGNFIGTRNINIASSVIGNDGSTSFQYSFITTITDVQWDCVDESSTLTSLGIAAEPVKYKDIKQINDKKLNCIIKSNIVACYIVLSGILLIGLVILGISSLFMQITTYMIIGMSLSYLSMLVDVPNCIFLSLLNALGRYKELSIISIIIVTIKVSLSFLQNVYVIHISMLLAGILQTTMITILFLYYKHKYRDTVDIK